MATRTVLTVDGTVVVVGSAYTSLNAAVTAIGSSQQTTLLVDKSLPIGANTTITDNIELIFIGSGQITGTGTIVIEGHFNAPYKRVWASTITVTIANTVGLKPDMLNARQFGAKGTDDTDDTDALLNCISRLTHNSWMYLPQGRYWVSDTLEIGDLERVKIFGPGVLVPQSGLSGKPVLQFRDSRECTLEGIDILGNSAFPPASLLRFHQTASGAFAQGGHTIRSVLLGSPSTDSQVDGIDHTFTSDQNNEHNHFINVEVINCIDAAFNVEHSNSLLHIILGGLYNGGTHSFRFAGGSAQLFGPSIGCKTGQWLCEYVSGSTQFHTLEFHGVHSEGSFKYFKLAANDLSLQTQGCHFKGSVDGADNIEVSGSNVRIHSNDTVWGGGGTTVGFNGGTSTQNFFGFVGGELGFNSYTWNGHLGFVNAVRSPGAITLTPQASATFSEYSSIGGTGGDASRGYRVGKSGNLGQAITGMYSAVRANVQASDYSTNPIAANAAAFFDITVTGLETDGKAVVLANPDVDIGNGLSWSAFPLSNNTVRVWVVNVTGSGIAPGTGNWRATVFQHA